MFHITKTSLKYCEIFLQQRARHHLVYIVSTSFSWILQNFLSSTNWIRWQIFRTSKLIELGVGITAVSCRPYPSKSAKLLILGYDQTDCFISTQTYKSHTIWLKKPNSNWSDISILAMKKLPYSMAHKSAHAIVWSSITCRQLNIPRLKGKSYTCKVHMDVFTQITSSYANQQPACTAASTSANHQHTNLKQHRELWPRTAATWPN